MFPSKLKSVNKNCGEFAGEISNPFMIESKTCQNRMFKSNDPHNLKGNTTYARLVEIDKGSMVIQNPTDCKVNYLICPPTGEVPNFLKKEELSIPLSMYDYDIPAEILNERRLKRNKKPIFKDSVPVSFIQIDNEIDGINWYREHYPKIPTDLLPIIARYHWGDAITKKSIKNEKKKLKKKQIKYSRQYGKQVVKFD